MQYLSFSIISIELEAEHRIFMRETISRTDKGQPRPKYIFNKMCVVMPYFITFLKLVSVLIQAICIPQCVSYRYNSLSNTKFLHNTSVCINPDTTLYVFLRYLSFKIELTAIPQYVSIQIQYSLYFLVYIYISTHQETITLIL